MPRKGSDPVEILRFDAYGHKKYLYPSEKKIPGPGVG
jgi:hypothetical protein